MRKRQKYVLLLTIFLLLASGMAGLCIAASHSEPAWHPRQFVIADGRPCQLQDGQVWRYMGEKRWEQVPLPHSVQQILSGETFWVLFEDGLLYPSESPVIEDPMPLTSAFYVEMTLQLLTLNKSQPFSQVGGNPSYRDVLALLPDGTVLSLQTDAYSPCTLEETAFSVSGRYILTQQGNLYYLEENMASPQIVRQGEHIVSITTDVFDHDACLALTADGRVLSFDRDWRCDPYDGSTALVWTGLATKDWRHITSIAQGHNFAAGVTKQGKVIFVGDLPPQSLADIEKELSGWRHITAIAAYNTQLYGLQADGGCVCLELEPFLSAR